MNKQAQTRHRRKSKEDLGPFSVQNIAVLATAKILHKALQQLRPLVEDLSLKEEQTTQGERATGIFDYILCMIQIQSISIHSIRIA